MKSIEVEGVIGRLSSRADKSLNFSVHTPELSVEERSAFFEFQDVPARFFIKPLTEAIDGMVDIQKDLLRKTPSQRLRGVLFVWFKQLAAANQIAPDTLFEDFYSQRMNGFVEEVKSQLAPQ